MLPLELLNVIFGALSRDDLDALMLTNVLFRDVVLRDFAGEPFRFFDALNIFGCQTYGFSRPTRRYYHCKDNDDFGRRMRLARVGELRITSAHFNENLFNVLLPFRNAWREGHIDMQPRFAAQSLLERAFRELLFCKSMDVIGNGLEGQLSQSFISLPAVRECTSLRILAIPLTVAEVLEWLNVDARSKEPKRLAMYDTNLRDSVDNLV